MSFMEQKPAILKKITHQFPTRNILFFGDTLNCSWDFPGSPAVKMSHFRGGGMDLISGQGTRSHMLCGTVKKKLKRIILARLKKNCAPNLSSIGFLISFASLVAQVVKTPSQCRRPGSDPWVQKIPWRRKWQPTPVFLPGESHGQRSLVGWGIRFKFLRLQDIDVRLWIPTI